MAGKRRTYTADDRARVHTLLVTNDGNVDRTVRESGVPRATVLRWKQQWQKQGLPEEVAEAVPAVAGEFLEEATSARNEAIVLLRTKLPTASVKDLAVIVGILDDKIARASGLASSRVEHVVTPSLPSPEELGPMLGDYLNRALAAQRRRHFVVGEVVEEPAPKALPPAETKE